MLNVTNITTDIELMGISIAAMMGERFPDTANNKPMILYKKDITKLIFIINIVL